MKIHKLNCGVLHPLKLNAFVNNLSIKLPLSIKSFKKGKFFSFDCNCLLIEEKGKLLLVDCGFSEKDFKNPERRIPLNQYRMIGNFEKNCDYSAKNQIVNLGFSLSNVTDIIITHLDFDHVAGIEDFPDAKIHVCSRELRTANKPKSINEKLRYLPHLWNFHKNLLPFKLISESWNGFYKGKLQNFNFSENVFPIFLPGHTDGHCGVVIKTASKTIVFTGDAYMFSSQLNMEGERLPLYSKIYRKYFQVNYEIAHQTLEKLRFLKEKKDLKIEFINSHEPMINVNLNMAFNFLLHNDAHIK